METEELERLAASITPGPWMSDDASVKVPDKRQSSIAVCVRLGTRSEVEARTNARAISLLPELLAEVIAIRRASGQTTTNQNYDDPVSSRQDNSESAEPVDDASLQYRIGEIGNQIHNIACEYQDDELSERLGELRGRLWSIASEMAHSAPMTVEAAAQVLLDKWLHGEFEDDADAIAQDQLDYGGDASSVVEAWLRAALTPAPQPEGLVMDGWVDDKTFIEPVSARPPQPASETVAWRNQIANLSVWSGKAYEGHQLVDLAHVLAIIDEHPPAPMTVEAAAQVLLDAHEDNLEMFGKGRTLEQVATIVGALRALAAKGGQHE